MLLISALLPCWLMFCRLMRSIYHFEAKSQHNFRLLRIYVVLATLNQCNRALSEGTVDCVLTRSCCGMKRLPSLSKETEQHLFITPSSLHRVNKASQGSKVQRCPHCLVLTHYSPCVHRQGNTLPCRSHTNTCVHLTCACKAAAVWASAGRRMDPHSTGRLIDL